MRQQRAKLHSKVSNTDARAKKAAGGHAGWTPDLRAVDAARNTPEEDDAESKLIMRSNEPIQSVINGIYSQHTTIDNISERPTIATVPRD